MSEYKHRSFATRLRFAIAGVAHGLSTERSLKVQASVFVLVLVGLIILQPPPVWWAVVMLSSSCVLAAELFNTALERLADRLHPETHPEIRIVKDCAAAAVLVAVMGAVVVAGALVFEVLRLGAD